jgi:hypothetical protein
LNKRTAEKVISKSFLTLATYRKSTMSRALRRRPRFWTVPKRPDGALEEPARKRLRLQFGEAGAASRFSLEYSAFESAAGAEM